ncbi:MAG TPA: four helix bundle protein [Vicinamibacterales bacterium]|nr:four helix bundle protein [Vicinamibacterales bacterium]
MTPQQLRERAKKFAVAIVRLCRSLPSDWVVREVGKQLVRAGTAVAANYRACQRGRSDKEFCAKIGVVVEEADETELWLELLQEADPQLATAETSALIGEARELVAIFSASHRTAKANLERKKAHKRKERASHRRTP